MADANLVVGVEVELRPDENTSRWLESLGWVRPDGAETEGVDVSQVNALYEQWVAEGAPPLGTQMARWWDRKLVELRNAIRPPEPVAVEEDDEYDPIPADIADLVPQALPLRTGGVYRGRAMGGAEAMRYRAAVLRRDLMNEVSSPERVDEMLRNMDVDPEALPDPDCDC